MQTHYNQQATYTCPMHPEVKSDKPGNCPKCGMKLVEKNSNSANSKSNLSYKK